MLRLATINDFYQNQNIHALDLLNPIHAFKENEIRRFH